MVLAVKEPTDGVDKAIEVAASYKVSTEQTTQDLNAHCTIACHHIAALSSQTRAQKAELAKAANKKADHTAHTLRINQEIASRVSSRPLASYKRKMTSSLSPLSSHWKVLLWNS